MLTFCFQFNVAGLKRLLIMFKPNGRKEVGGLMNIFIYYVGTVKL